MRIWKVPSLNASTNMEYPYIPASGPWRYPLPLPMRRSCLRQSAIPPFCCSGISSQAGLIPRCSLQNSCTIRRIWFFIYNADETVSYEGKIKRLLPAQVIRTCADSSLCSYHELCPYHKLLLVTQFRTRSQSIRLQSDPQKSAGIQCGAQSLAHAKLLPSPYVPNARIGSP